MKKIAEQGILYDFYGAILSEHQRRICEAYIYDDLSLSEIAEQEGISRQGVHDLLGRCFRRMQEMEDRLQLLRQYREGAAVLGELGAILGGGERRPDGSRVLTASEGERAEALLARLSELLDNTENTTLRER